MYHVSTVAGIEVLEPREPQCAQDVGEPLVPRVCAAPTITDCLQALGEMEWGVEYYVYQIDAAPDVDNLGVVNWPAELGGIEDAEVTGEVWYLTPVPCVFWGPLEQYYEKLHEYYEN